MRYKTRPGVILTSICGEHILVAAKSVLDLCPFVTEINETSAFLWKALENGADIEQLMDAVQAEYEIDDPDTVRSAINSFIEQMLELNYLVALEKGAQNE
ncbi:MAG: PqqD family protein [Clostridia bacterium]|nr:PqqD family protein [Clostridia bacterium]